MRDNLFCAIVMIGTVAAIVFMIGYAIDRQIEYEINNGQWTEVVK